MISWQKKGNLDPNIVITKLQSIQKKVDEKSISYQSFDFIQIHEVLLGMLHFPTGFSHLDHMSLLKSAVLSLSKSGKFNKNELLREINKLAKEKASSKKSKYRFLTEISLSPPYPAKNISMNGIDIRFISGEFPKKYAPRKSLIENFLDVEPKKILDFAKLLQHQQQHHQILQQMNHYAQSTLLGVFIVFLETLNLK